MSKINSKYSISKTIIVNETNDYTLFHKLKGNRPVDKSKVNRIKQSMMAHDVPCPIITFKYKDKLFVLDGQHRLEACKDLGKTVEFIIAKSGDLQTCIDMNNAEHPWNIKEYLEAYIDMGSTEHKWLYDMKNNYNATFSMLAHLISSHGTICAGNVPGGYGTDTFKNVNFSVPNTDKVAVENALKYLLKYQPYLKGFGRREVYYSAILTCKNAGGTFDEKKLFDIFKNNRIPKTDNKEFVLCQIMDKYNNGKGSIMVIMPDGTVEFN